MKIRFNPRDNEACPFRKAEIAIFPFPRFVEKF